MLNSLILCDGRFIGQAAAIYEKGLSYNNKQASDTMFMYVYH